VQIDQVTERLELGDLGEGRGLAAVDLALGVNRRGRFALQIGVRPSGWTKFRLRIGP
jgi:hypothetical protein